MKKSLTKKAVVPIHLFENEIVEITKIHAVHMYHSVDNFNGARFADFRNDGPHNQLIYILDGDNKVLYNDKKLHEQANTIRFLPTNTVLRTKNYVVERLKHGVCIDIYFDMADGVPPEALVYPDMDKLRNKFLQLYNIWHTRKPGYYTQAMAVFYQIIHDFREYRDTYTSSKVLNALNPSLDYIHAHYLDEKFDFETCCAASGYSYSYFKELFCQKYRMPPVKYVRMLRLEYAKELLLSRRYSVSEVAALCGYDNVYYFSNVFKKEIGVSPKNYKGELTEHKPDNGSK